MDSKRIMALRVMPMLVFSAFLLLPKVALAENLEVQTGNMRIRVANDGQVQIKGDQLQVQTPGYSFRRFSWGDAARSPYLDRDYRYRRPDLSAWRRACNGQANTQEQVYTQRSPDGSIYQRSAVITQVCR